MAGGLFAISAEFFWELGGYDPGLDIWGGEQYELSFKIWQCGGVMLDAPCSRIGHIYRKFAPFSNPGVGDYLGRNYKRVAEVWMDEYADYIYRRRPHYYDINPGDLTEQKAIRKRLNCKPFKWFMTEIAYDLTKVYPPVEPPDFASGTIWASVLWVPGEQVFHLTWHKDIRPGKRPLCWDVSSGETQAPVLLYSCHGGMGNQLWKYDYVNQQLIHGVIPRCLDSNPGNMEIFVSVCDVNKETQKWSFERYEAKKLDNWDNDGLVM
ncbi:N-acetylgalactosaminyltransferase 6 [Armadillidium vulgare]|nr:N-acetylgalactosaminyltransferase 6 [Armadillidium vulgare]